MFKSSWQRDEWNTSDSIRDSPQEHAIVNEATQVIGMLVMSTLAIESHGNHKTSLVIRALREHWPEYLMEAAGLGIFMLSACSFGVLLGYEASPAVRGLSDPILRRVICGVAMGITAICITYSP